MRTRNRTAPGSPGRLRDRLMPAVAGERSNQGDLFMQLETTKDALTDQLAAPTTRRTIVKTGIKLGYAIPLVAATYKLTERGALAACGGTIPIPFQFSFLGELVDLCCGCSTRVIPSETAFSTMPKRHARLSWRPGATSARSPM